MRIVPLDFWQIVKARQAETRKVLATGTPLVRVRRPTYLVTSYGGISPKHAARPPAACEGGLATSGVKGITASMVEEKLQWSTLTCFCHSRTNL